MHKVQAKGILSPKNGMNIYRGCQHGCIYCDSRSSCYQMKHDFEDIEVKENAPQLLEAVLRSKRKKCMIGTGSMSDPYLPLEQELMLTRKCLEIIERYGFGLSILTKSNLILRDLDLLKAIHKKAKCVVQMTLTTFDEELCKKRYGFGLSILTKSNLILRDLDLLKAIHKKAKCVVQMTLTTFDEELCKKIEPGVCTTKERAEVLKVFQREGIPTVVWMTPILPLINDTPENIRGLLNYCVEAGVRGIVLFDMGMTLREGDREYFYEKLGQHFPGVREKYVRTYGEVYALSSPRREELLEIFRKTCAENGIMYRPEECFAYLREYEEKIGYEQLSLEGLLNSGNG